MTSVTLKVGFVSGDLANHPVGFFLESVLQHIDRSRIALFAYNTTESLDELSLRLKPMFTGWRFLNGLTDEAAAEFIHSDGIHVLLDLAGHTAKNRLPVFACKPAPVQATWLGYSGTTGIRQMDYIVGDPYVTPYCEQGNFTEKIWHLPERFQCFTPPQIDLIVGKLPMQTSNRIVFGCFNNVMKISVAVVALWARILLALPNATLFLKADWLDKPEVNQNISERFAEHGVDGSRLVFEGASSRSDYLSSYNSVDIALDPFPYNGGTTSIEGLWMGVPFITLKGNNFVSHMGESILHNVGLPDWIAADEDDYVSKAVRFASDIEGLARLRAGLRQQLLASPVCDAPRFAKHFENALWGMWREYEKRSEALKADTGQ